MEYKYYRAMPPSEAKELIKNEMYTNTKRNRGLTWWAETLADASRYAIENRVIVSIVLDHPLDGRKIAEFTDALPHVEYCISLSSFNKHLCNLLEDIKLV